MVIKAKLQKKIRQSGLGTTRMDAVIRRVIHDPIFVENVVRLLEKSMNLWKTELVAGGQAFCTVNIRRGIFQGIT